MGNSATLILTLTAEKAPCGINMAPSPASEILSAIKRLKSNKSPDKYGLPPEVFKTSPHIVVEQLESLFSLIGEKKIFPFDSKTSAIISAFEKGNKLDSRNYQYIPFIDIASQVFAVIFLKRLDGAKDGRKRKNQCRFRKGRGVH